MDAWFPAAGALISSSSRSDFPKLRTRPVARGVQQVRLERRKENVMTPYRHLLCPVDFSESSRYALEWSSKFSREVGARLTRAPRAGHGISLHRKYGGGAHRSR